MPETAAAARVVRSRLLACGLLFVLSMSAASAFAQSAQPITYQARAALEASAAGSDDPAALTALAAAQESFAGRAPATYAHLAKVLGSGTPERLHALERGFALALRENDPAQAASFAAQLEAEGQPEFTLLLHGKPAHENDAMIPGGLAPFAHMAQLPPGTTPDRIFAEFARQVARNVCWKCQGDRLTATMTGYFTAINGLEVAGQRDGNSVTLTLSLNGKDERSRAEHILTLLGLQMHSDKGQIRIESTARETPGKKPQPEIFAALGLDPAGIQQALQAGKPFVFSLHDEAAPVYPSARLWKESFPNIDQKQFALMLLGDPVMGRLYLGMSTLDRATVQTLIGSSGLFFFKGQPADMLSIYGSSFALDEIRAAVPGGAAAAPVWAQLVGVSPEKAGPFFHALIEAQNPTPLTFYYALSHLDRSHQAFYTANLARAKRLYALFLTLPESKAYAGDSTPGASFSSLLNSVPLDAQGHVAFPGSPAVWTKTSAPGASGEDDVLMHLFEARYKANSVPNSDFGAFLAVAHIDAHRAKPMDAESARLLAQHYSDLFPAYPYFTDITAIDAAGFRSFFNVTASIGKLPLLEQNLAMGQFYALLEWLSMLERRHAIDDAEAARLFTSICDRVASAGTEAARTLASVDIAQAIVAMCSHDAAGTLDDKLRGCLLGPAAEGADERGRDFQLVLSEQKAPSLDAIAAIVQATRTATPIAADALPSVPLPGNIKAVGKEKDAFLLYDPAPAMKLIAEWNQSVAHSPQDTKNTQRIAADLLKALEPQVTLALAGPLYAYGFRGGDAAIQSDPLLLRKHQYLDLAAAAEHRLVFASIFVWLPDSLGKHVQGSFAQFGLASGYAAASGWKQGGDGGSAVIAEQIAALRGTAWETLEESDQRLVALRILAAREWIVAAAQTPAYLAALSDETIGLLSLTRRAGLLHGLLERDWELVWASVTLPDLFRLGGGYLARFPQEAAPSATVAQLRLVAAANDGHRLNALAAIPNNALGCDHTHFVPVGPYEEDERQILATYIGERTAELKLFLAFHADSLGLPPAQLPPAAEKLAAKAFAASHMSDYHDWRGVMAAYAGLTDGDLKRALEP